MKLITDSNLELVIQAFYDRVVDEFTVAESAHKLETGRTLTIGNSAKVFDGTENVFWSLTDIGIGSPSNLSTVNKSDIVSAINEVNANKASISYVDNAVENVTIEDAVIAVEVVGDLEDIETDYVTQAELNNYITQDELEDELEDALAGIGDIDIEGMVTAVDAGSVNIGQSSNAVIGDLSSLLTTNKGSIVDAINELYQMINSKN